MNIDKISFHSHDGREYSLRVVKNWIVFANDLEVVNKFPRNEESVRKAAEEIFVFVNEFSPTYGDLVEYESVLKMML